MNVLIILFAVVILGTTQTKGLVEVEQLHYAFWQLQQKTFAEHSITTLSYYNINSVKFLENLYQAIPIS